MVKCGNGSSRSKYNQRNGRPGGNDYRNNRPPMGQRQQNNGMTNGGGYQRQSRFGNGPVNNAYGSNVNQTAAFTTRPAMAAYPNQNGTRFDAVAPANVYQQYQSAATPMPVAMYTAPPPAVASFNYPPPILPVKN